MIRVAAVADVHFAEASAGDLRPRLRDLRDRADVFLMAGDLTQHGEPREAATLAEELRGIDVPILATLGNHDYHAGRVRGVRRALRSADIRVLEGESDVVEVGGERLGVAGIKGFAGGFAGADGSDFGEPEMKTFVRHTKKMAGRLDYLLRVLEADIRVALLHYAPVRETLRGEPRELYPFLGSSHLAEAADAAGADLVLHGHAHHGSETGTTPRGVPVRNVARSVIDAPYRVLSLHRPDAVRPDGNASVAAPSAIATSR